MLNLLISSIFANNVTLNNYLGIEEVIKERNFYLKLMFLIVTLVTNIIMYFINNYLLMKYDVSYLSTIVLILTLIIVVQVLQLLFKGIFKSINNFNPFLYINSATFGLILLNIISDYNFIDTIIFSLGSSVGLLLIIYIYQNINPRLKGLKIVDAFEEMPILLIIMGILSLIFSKYGLK